MHVTEPVMTILQATIATPRLLTRVTAILLVLAISSSFSATAESPVEKLVAETDKAGADPKPVEERKSSQASRAKGEINFDDLKFEIEKDKPFKSGMLNEDVKKLDGQKVKLRGYILPATIFKPNDIDQFVLVRDNQECCFGPGAALFDCVIVEMVPGKTTDFVTRPVTVEGRFKIDTEKYKYPGGAGPRGASHFAIFKIAGEAVK